VGIGVSDGRGVRVGGTVRVGVGVVVSVGVLLGVSVGVNVGSTCNAGTSGVRGARIPGGCTTRSNSSKEHKKTSTVMTTKKIVIALYSPLESLFMTTPNVCASRAKRRGASARSDISQSST
jgi:hypothetical protein